MYTSKDEREFRLELFDGKAYAVAQTGLLDAMQTASETAPRPWRITLAEKDRPSMPKYRKPPAWNYRGDGYMGIRPFYAGGLSYEDWAICSYLDWAQAKGLKTVTAYRGHESERNARAGCFGFDSIRTVDVADFLGEAPRAEPDDYMPEAMAA